MRNLSTFQDILRLLDDGLKEELEQKSISDLTLDFGSDLVVVLFSDGSLIFFSIVDGFKLCDFNFNRENLVEAVWFSVQYVGELRAIIAISKSGEINEISCISDYENNLHRGLPKVYTCEEVGVVDGGIESASWSPDVGTLAIISGNNTLMLMKSNWEDVTEIMLPNRVPNSTCSLAWIGDGTLLAVMTLDASDKIYRVRLYSRLLEVENIARKVPKSGQDAGLIVGLEPCMAWSPNCTILACAFRKPPGAMHVCFLIHIP